MFVKKRYGYVSAHFEHPIMTSGVLHDQNLDKTLNYKQPQYKAQIKQLLEEISAIEHDFKPQKRNREEQLTKEEEKKFKHLFQKNKFLFITHEKTKTEVFNKIRVIQNCYDSLNNESAAEGLEINVGQNQICEISLNHNKILESRNFAQINQIFISRDKMYTCPAKTIIIYFSMQNCVQKEIFQKFCSIQNVTDLANYFKVERESKNKNVHYIEFTYKITEMHPAVAIQFRDKNTQEVLVQLQQFFIAKYVWVQFIEIENKQKQFKEICKPNVDCLYVGFRGSIIELP